MKTVRSKSRTKTKLTSPTPSQQNIHLKEIIESKNLITKKLFYVILYKIEKD